MRIIIFSVFIVFMIQSCKQSTPNDQFIVADDEFYQVVPASGTLEKVGGDYQFTEGPVWSDDGFLLFSDIPANRIYKWEPDGNVTVYIEPSRNSNGLALDNEGSLVACEHSGRAVVIYEKDGTRKVLADKYRGKKLNSPNDLVIHSSGPIFFTDPPYGLPQQDADPAKEIRFNGVYLIRDGSVIVIDSTLYRPNGITLSPDESYLYVGNNQYTGGTENIDKGLKAWYRYELNEDLTVKEKIEFCRAPDSSIQGNPDGMKVDVIGNLYCTGPGGLLIFNPDGKYLGTIVLPEIPTNCAFGNPKRKTLFITDRKQVFSIALKIEGI